MGLGSGHGVGTGVGGLALWRRLRRLGPAGSRRLHDQLRLLSTELVLCSGNALRRTRRVSLRASGRTLPRGVLRDQPYSRAGALWRNSVECETSAGPGIPSGGSPDPAGEHHPAPTGPGSGGSPRSSERRFDEQRLAGSFAWGGGAQRAGLRKSSDGLSNARIALGGSFASAFIWCAGRLDRTRCALRRSALGSSASW